MRRIIIVGTTLAAMAGGAVALAATGDFNSYTATQLFCKSTPAATATTCTPSPAGSTTKPAPMAIKEDWKASGSNGDLTAPLTRIVTDNYGMVTNGKAFPTCTPAMINNAGTAHGTWNHVCPAGSLIGQGPVTALLVAPKKPAVGQQQGVPCNPYLWIYNGGPATDPKTGKKYGQTQVFFFTETGKDPNGKPFAPTNKSYTCAYGNVQTGKAPAYYGYVTNASSSNGNMWSINIPLPPSVSTNAGGTGLYASLVTLDVVYAKLTEKKNGKVIPFGASVACKNNKRPYSLTFYAQNYQGAPGNATQTTTVSHKAAC